MQESPANSRGIFQRVQRDRQSFLTIKNRAGKEWLGVTLCRFLLSVQAAGRAKCTILKYNNRLASVFCSAKPSGVMVRGRGSISF